ncbi:MAG TPA: 3-hydroxy-fatty acyl-ACP dehydratase [Scandinavium sp.]|jgi:predicted hotdog family 3-hydroxylacyl-ACP dehydratase
MSHYLSPGAYLPHNAPMLLLESVLNVTDEQAICQVTVNRQGVLAPFVDASGNLPGWYALELMAQTVGVWSGWHRQQKGEAQITLGMVLGARELKCVSSEFSADSVLDITVSMLMQDGRVGSFECVITAGGEPLATGRVNTFQPTPEELTTLFQQGSSS